MVPPLTPEGEWQMANSEWRMAERKPGGLCS